MFGVNCEALPRQVNFLCDEAGDCGKEANTVISQLHFFFAHHGLREMEVFLHADNCTGQNKNNAMLWYLAWRVMMGLHTQITLSFLVVGHTKFSPDWCFGLFKRLYRRTEVGSLQAIAQVVNNSASCNAAQLVVDEVGNTIVPFFDWVSFLAPVFKKLPGIKKLHHFRFNSSQPGVVFIKTHCDQPEKQHTLLKKNGPVVTVDDFPCRITPSGLSTERQWYLHDKIREFCPVEARDTTCPLPDGPRPTSRAGTPADPDPDPESSGGEAELAPEVTPPPAKRARRCGICKGEGHNSRTCPQQQS